MSDIVNIQLKRVIDKDTYNTRKSRNLKKRQANKLIRITFLLKATETTRRVERKHLREHLTY